jgi:hypothetical protein
VSAQERISKLQGLLNRIQKNAGRPRTSAVLPTAPAAFAAPAPAMPPPQPAHFAAPAPASNFDQSVDDLLAAAPEASPLPVEIDVPLDSVPPVAEVFPTPAPEAEPVPLVSMSTGQAVPPPPPIDDAFSLESEVSEVRVTTAMREPATEVTVEAIAAEAEPIGAEELSEDDLVEVTEGTPPPAATDVDIDFEDEDEQPPASSQRSRVASSMDEALAAAAEQLEAEREVPLKTPPPESGPQAAPPPTGLAAPPAPDVDALLGGELDIPTRADSGITAASGPTAEQLGETIDLEEARGPSLELAEHQQAAAAPAPIEELEVPLPGPTLVGGYDENLQPPPEARDDLEAHRRRQEDDIPPPPESLAQLPSEQPGPPAAAVVPIYHAQPEPELVARPIPSGSPEAFAAVREPFRPSSFVELLDASLALDGE